MTAIEHSAQAFTDAPDGAWGILWDHAPGQEAVGNYTLAQAAERAFAVQQAQPGVTFLLVKRRRDDPRTVANGYVPVQLRVQHRPE